MELLASLLSSVAINTTGDTRTAWLVLDEPECPEELI